MNNAKKITENVKITQAFGGIFYFLFQVEPKKSIFLLSICLIFGLIPTIDSLLIGQVTDLIESYIPGQDISSQIIFWTISYALWWESINVVWRIFDFVYLKTMPKIKAEVIDSFYNKVQHHSNDFFQENFAGDITNKITGAAKSIEMIFYFLIEKIAKKSAMIIFGLITLASVHTHVGLIFGTWLVIFISTSFAFMKKINQLSLEYSISRTNVAGRIVDSVSNISVIRMFTSHKYERKFLGHHISNMVNRDQKLQKFLLVMRYFLGLSTSIMIFSMIYYILQLRVQDLISTGDCVIVITLSIAIIDEVWDFSQEFGDLFDEVGAFSVALTLAETCYIHDKEDAIEIDAKDARINFKNVTFNYRRNNNIFNNKSVEIPANQKVGLAGFSGSGKSTFAKLIARLYEIENGQITINDVDIRDIKQDSLRAQISIIPQEPILFHRNILDNIKYGSEHATMEEVIEAAKAAHIHDEIMAMDEGYNKSAGERGDNLSGGQKQRIIIARAFLKKAPILILDEATSSLDTITEDKIQHALTKLMQDKTVLVIAHKLSTFKEMDRILVFDKGNIVEDGTHESLLKNGKIYQHLWESQAKGFR